MIDWLWIVWAFMRLHFHCHWWCHGQPVTYVDDEPILRLTIQCNCGQVFYDMEFSNDGE